MNYKDKKRKCNCPLGCSAKNGGCPKEYNSTPYDVVNFFKKNKRLGVDK